MSQCERKDGTQLSSSECWSEKHDDKFKPERAELRRTKSAVESCMSTRCNQSTDYPVGSQNAKKIRTSPTPSIMSVQSYKPMDHPSSFRQGLFSQVHQDASAELTSQHRTNLDSVFQTLERDTVAFVKTELKKFHRLLDPESPKDFKSQDGDDEVFGSEELARSSSNEALLIILEFLRLINEGAIADALLNSDFTTSQCDDLSSDDRLSEERDGTRSKRVKMERRKSVPPSCVPVQSNKSMDYPVGFKQAEDKPGPNYVSLQSNKSMDYPVGFRRAEDKPGPNFVSVQSNKSMDYPVGFKQAEDKPGPNYVSLQSNKSMDYPVGFRRAEDKPGPNYVSLQSNKSMDYPVGFKQAEQKTGTPTPSVVSLKSNKSMDYPVGFKRDSFSEVHQKDKLNKVFKTLEEKIVPFVKKELKKFHKMLDLESFKKQSKEEEMVDCEEEEQKMKSKEAFLKITLQCLRRMKLDELAHVLLNRSLACMCHCKLKSNLKKRSTYVFEGIAKAGNPTPLNKIYTELYITEGTPAEVHSRHEVKLIERAFVKPARPEITISCEDIFKPFSDRDKPIRTVMTEGVAGIGKTVLTQKFTLDWAEGKANQDIQFLFPLTFRELNMVKTKQFSLVELIHLFFPETKEAGIHSFKEFRCLFIFDGLDECRFPLNLKSKEILTDVTKSTSLDLLLTNLIKGKLLPSAHIWITSRPAAAYQIPPELVDLVTEVRGFTDPQKEEYFRKRFTDEETSRTIISHIKATRSLHIMCHIPIFCWISSTVLEDAFKTREKRELPKSLTEMYVYFLVVLCKVKRVKYDDDDERAPLWSSETRKMVQSLGKLAFEQLMKGNLFFYESDLAECGIDIKAASVYSGVFTEIFQEERVLFNEKVFCFVHLSIQEFLAALHVHLTFTNTGVNLLTEEESGSQRSTMSKETFELFYQTAVDKALQSHKGHLDLFLRFLLGLSQKTSQTLLRGFVTENEIGTSSGQNTVQYIKKKISENVCILKNGNLFHCLNELKDGSLIEEIQQTLKLKRLPTDKLSPAHWAALINIILSSEENQVKFDLKNYFESDEAAVGLMSVVINCSTAVLSCCNLTEASCTLIATGLQSKCLVLKELDLSNNNLKDSGIKLLCKGFCSPNCKLETLRLSGCLITKEGCADLAACLGSNPSHLKELDVTYNHPEESGVKLLTAKLEDPSCALQTLRVEPSGSQFLKPGLGKYACEPVLDSDPAHRNLTLSDNNRKVTVGGEKQSNPEDPARSDVFEQLLCKNSLTGRCYWEVEWRGKVHIGLTYKGTKRRGESSNSSLGINDQSWSLLCSDDGHSGLHDNIMTSICGTPSNRVGVYLDWPGGSLSFFRVSSDKLNHLQTFNTKFTEPVYPAFEIATEPFNSSLTLF